jgi:glycosyltransferase involved in cell wall biosynthesis
MMAALRTFDPDAIIVRGAGTRTGDEIFAGFECPVAIIVGGGFKVRSLSAADLVLCESPQQERYLRLRLGRRAVMLLPKLPGPEFWSVERRLVGHDFDVVAVGKLSANKNHVALDELVAKGFRVAIVGDGPLRGELADRWAGRQVEFTGSLSRHEVAEVFSRSKLLVHPSWSEGLPRVVIEAMASGLPPVGARGVLGWPVVDGLNGVVTERSRLTSEVVALLEDDHRRQQLESEARRTASELFGPARFERAADSLICLLQDSLSSNPARASLHLRLRQARWDAVSPLDRVPDTRTIRREVRRAYRWIAEI